MDDARNHPPPEDESTEQAKLEALRAVIAEGLEGPFFDGPTVMAELRERIRTAAGDTNEEDS
jgi:hypothetical protein